MRVVFDTNILVLSFLGNPATAIMRAALTTGPLVFFYTSATLAEYRNALGQASRDRPAPFREHRVRALLADVEARGRLVSPTATLTTADENACSHEPDNRFLECAIQARARYIVTVNDRHFPPTYRTADGWLIEVVRPARFAAIIFSE